MGAIARHDTHAMAPAILALNCGSSSFKFKLYDVQSLDVIAAGNASGIGTDKTTLKLGNTKHALNPHESHHDIFKTILQNYLDQDIQVCTHRIVHGGSQTEPLVITKEHAEGLETMDKLSAFAPLHNHHAVLVVKSALDLLPKATNVLCFDTLFHKTMPPAAFTYAIPAPEIKPPVELRRYGFHGLSYASILKSVSLFLKKDPKETSLVVCHLGSGASMCCIQKGQSIDTTMGVTPLEGLPGGTRSGTVDPSLVFHLFGQQGASEDMVTSNGITASKGELLLNKASGFKGLCGTSDFLEITQQAAKGSEKHQLTIDVFVHAILKYLGSYLLQLKNKPDAIVFSGGIGEKSSLLRQTIIDALDYLDVSLDKDANEADSDDVVFPISSKQSKMTVLRVLTDEELECAHLAVQTLSLS